MKTKTKRLSDNDMISAEQQAKEDKKKIEALNTVEEVKPGPDKSKAGLENPCVFGKHNPDYNKRYLNEI